MRLQQLADTMGATLEEQIGFLDPLSSVFANGHLVVTRQDFHHLVQKLRERFATIRAAEWHGVLCLPIGQH
jgi:hypothetical protein